MMKFIDIIILYSMIDILISKDIYHKTLFVILDKTNRKFALKLYRNSNIITAKI